MSFEIVCCVVGKRQMRGRWRRKAIDKFYIRGSGVKVDSGKSKLKIKQGKKSIKSGYKKAIITLSGEDKIDLINGDFS